MKGGIRPHTSLLAVIFMGRLVLLIQIMLLFQVKGVTQSMETNHHDTSLVAKDYNTLKSKVFQLTQSHKFAEAALICDQFLNSYPADSLVNYISGTIYFDLKKYDIALNDFNRAKEGRLHQRELYYLSGLCNYYLVNDQSAIDDFKKALDFGEDPQTIFLIGVCSNNLKSKSGCGLIKRAIDLGFPDQGGVYKSDCN